MSEEVRVSRPPEFDFEKAFLAKETTESGYAGFPTVRAVGNLWLYNTPIDRWDRVLSKLSRLLEVETRMSAKDNPLPTIGWEVESPRIPYKIAQGGMYALFFDFMGLPRNREQEKLVPGNPSTYKSFWEFSTTPAYSAAVANRTLCELIKGNFIPHLEGFSTEWDRFTKLDDKLVSLHINLGIPDWLIECAAPTNLWLLNPANSYNPDILLLASSFALGYTSALRFLHRSNKQVIVNRQGAEPTLKHPDSGGYRFEFKALEVSDSRTYCLMQDIQLVTGAAFCAIARRDTNLAGIWADARDELREIYSRYGVSTITISLMEGQRAANIVNSTNMGRELVGVLTRAANQVRLALR